MHSGIPAIQSLGRVLYLSSARMLFCGSVLDTLRLHASISLPHDKQGVLDGCQDLMKLDVGKDALNHSVPQRELSTSL